MRETSHSAFTPISLQEPTADTACLQSQAYLPQLPFSRPNVVTMLVVFVQLHHVEMQASHTVQPLLACVTQLLQRLTICAPVMPGAVVMARAVMYWPH